MPIDPHFDASARVPRAFDASRWRAVEEAAPLVTPWGTLAESVRRSSQGRPWPGLILWHQVGPEGDLYVPPTANHCILVRRALPTQLLQRHGRATEVTRWQPGQSLVVPAGVPTFWRSAMPRDNLHVDLAPAWLQRAAQGDVALQSCFGRDDPVLASFAQLLLASLDSNASLNVAFGEHIAEAIALHLLEHYAKPQPALRGPAGLSRRQMQSVEDAVLGDLAQHWTIEAMARIAQLSAFHFARAFKTSFGVAPRAWVRLQRMEAAASLVRDSRRPLSEIAGLTGHRSPAHFAQVFRQHWGVSPSSYRRGG
jgi:AraC family transcriptional regulator